MLELQNIRKQFNGKTVADGISLQVARGSLLAILGRSGCGKSTLLNIAAGLTAPDGGRVLLDGTDITALPPEKRRISLMFQDYALLPHLSVLQNTAFGLKMRGTAKRQAEEAAEAMLEQVGLSGEGHRRPDTLSGGEQQRVALARALAAEPKLLLLDEPFSSLDTGLRNSLRNLTRAQAGRLNIPAVLVTHDPEEAFLMADRIALMADGRIIQEGSPDELGAHPNSAAAAKLLGCRNVSDTFYLPPDALFPDPDGPASLRGAEMNCDVMLKATNVDGVYTADPKKDPSAVRYETITFDEALSKRLKVMDATAFALCRERQLNIVVFGIAKEGALKRVVCGENEGTLVHC